MLANTGRGPKNGDMKPSGIVWNQIGSPSNTRTRTNCIWNMSTVRATGSPMLLNATASASEGSA